MFNVQFVRTADCMIYFFPFRLYRAKTTCSGAVLIDEGEGENSSDDLHSNLNASLTTTCKDSQDGGTDIGYPDEERLMMQVAIATKMKNEVMGSIKGLGNTGDGTHGDTADQKEGRDEGGFIRPSEMKMAASQPPDVI